MIAMALAGDPGLLLADEPTTALDVSVQMGVLRLLRDIQRDRAMAVVFVTHDIGVVREVAQDVVVMYGGRVAEQGPLQRVLGDPAHPYTAGLLRSTLTLGHRGRPTEPIPGEPPVLAPDARGCAFAPRCPRADEACANEVALAAAAPGHAVRCVHPLT
jgi:oligopeptide/dipeptide ABC transporter ATP-binding protein